MKAQSPIAYLKKFKFRKLKGVEQSYMKARYKTPESMLTVSSPHHRKKKNFSRCEVALLKHDRKNTTKNAALLSQIRKNRNKPRISEKKIRI